MLRYLPDAESPILVALTALVLALIAAALALLIWGVPSGVSLHFALASSSGSVTVIAGLTLLVAFGFSQGGTALSIPGRMLVLVLLSGMVAACAIVPIAVAAHRARRVMGAMSSPRSTVSLDATGSVVVSASSDDLVPILGRMLPSTAARRTVAVLSYQDAVRLTGLMAGSDQPEMRHLAMAN